MLTIKGIDMAKEKVERKKFPKPTGRIGKGLIGNLVDAATDAAAEVAKAKGVPGPIADALNETIDKVVMPNREAKPEAPVVAKQEVLPPVAPKTITLTFDPDTKATHIDIQGLNPFDSLVILKNAHKYLYTQLQKEMEKLSGLEEGAANTVSGGNS
jgi:hypothetical protein